MRPIAPEPAPKDSRFSRGLRETFISLRNRNFRLFFIGQTISNSGNWLTNIALILLVLKLSGSGVAVGILAGCQYGPILFLSVWGGAIADRSDKRRMLFLTQGLEMAQSTTLAILAFMPHPPLLALYCVALFGGTVLAFDNPMRRSFVTEMVPHEDIPNAVVLYSAIVNISRVFGPALAGVLVLTLGFGWCFAIDAATYIAVIGCIALMRTKELRREAPKPKTKGEIKDAVRYLITQPSLKTSFIMLAAVGALAYNFGVTLPLFVKDSLHQGSGVFTFLYSVFGFGALVGAMMVARRSLVSLRYIVIGSGALGVSMLVLAASPFVWTAGIAICLVGISGILYMTSTTAIIQVEAKPEMHGRLLALQMVFVGGTAPIGGPLLGWMADSLGGRAPIFLGGSVCLLAAAYGLRALRTTAFSQEPHPVDRR